jgi:hypothetical protein
LFVLVIDLKAVLVYGVNVFRWFVASPVTIYAVAPIPVTFWWFIRLNASARNSSL